MELTTDRASPLPLGTQLAEQIRNAIHTGELERGEALPTIRDLAKRAGVNVNTAAAVYRELAEEGYLTQGRRAGTRVADAPPRSPERALAAALAEGARRRASAAGISPSDVALAMLAESSRTTKLRVAAVAATPLAAAQLGAQVTALLGAEVEAVPVTPPTYRSVDYHFTVLAPELSAHLPGAERAAPAAASSAGSSAHADFPYGPSFPAGAD